MRCVLLLIPLIAWSAASAQVKMPGGYPGKPPWADTARESSIYPVGDAIGVYTAVLDLYFIDGSDRPPIIVMHDTAESRRGGPCIMQCPEAWLHQSKIDPSTELAFAKMSPKRPKMVPFGYPIPIAYLSYDQSNQLRLEGDKILAAQHKPNGATGEDFLSALTRRFPGAWGFITLSKVGFDDAHSEALVSVNFFCGVACSSEENLFLRKIGNRWVVIERIPNNVDGLIAWSGMRYRGPIASRPGETQLLALALPNRTEGDDARAVYAAVLDSLYNFHGASPRRIVITDWFSVDADSYDSLQHRAGIDASTLAHYRFLGGVRAPLYENLKLRAPVTTLSRDSLSSIEQLGKPLEKIALDRQVMTETTPFWLGFRQRYPGAWGMVGFTRVAFNEPRTQALVFTSHTCGANCRNDDTWLVNRISDRWHVAERISRGSEKEWQLDSLRYLGADANPRIYAPRRIHGTFISKATGVPLPGLRFAAYVLRDSLFMRTDSEGRFELNQLPVYAAIRLSVPCQRQPLLPGPASRYSSRTQDAGDILVHPGTDSTVRIKFDPTHCLLGRRLRALANRKPLPQTLASGYPDATDAAVYRGVLDELYPARTGPVLLRPLVHRLWEYEFESELFRLEKQGVVDSTLEQRLGALPKDSVWIREGVSFGRKVVIFGPAEQKSLEEQAADISYAGEKRDFSLLGMVKEAYPGADRILSFSRIAYNQAMNQAVVQVVTNSDQPYDFGETMLLHKAGATWKVVRRHLDKEDTSGELVAGRCEPVDAVPTQLRVDQLERFVGDADITVIPTSAYVRKYAGTSRYHFTPTDTLHRYYWLPPKGDTRPAKRLQGMQKLATVEGFDKAGKPGPYPGELVFSPAGSTIAFFQPNTLDGSYEEFTILRISGRQFFGKWEAGSGPTYPLKGYFCGRLR